MPIKFQKLSFRSKPLYIETRIDSSFDTLWNHTQLPNLHEKWDLRFSKIVYIQKESENDPQKFIYSTSYLGINIEGVGESVANKVNKEGESTSVLKFASGDSKSIIKEGAGYWKYQQGAKGIKFSTGYDYQTRWDKLGRIIDNFVVRPMMVWGTAVSFDVLKKWLEEGIRPKQSFISLLTVLLIQLVLGVVWIYQGLVPKLLFTDSGELEILRNSGIFNGFEEIILFFIGVGEILFGIFFFCKLSKRLYIINIIMLLVLGLGALFSNAVIYTLPFNPFSLNIALICLSVIGYLQFEFVPMASNCITKKPK